MLKGATIVAKVIMPKGKFFPEASFVSTTDPKRVDRFFSR